MIVHRRTLTMRMIIILLVVCKRDYHIVIGAIVSYIGIIHALYPACLNLFFKQ
jgi:hypothetical protein